MKHYVGIEAKATKKVYGGYNVTLKVYQIKGKNLIWLGNLQYCTASTRGDYSEVYNFLIDNKHIPKIAYKYSRSGNSGDGYYLTSNKWCNIKIISNF